MSAESRSDKECNTARDPTPSEESTTARDPTPSEGSNTAKEPSSAKDLTAREPGTDTEQDNRNRIQTELEGPVKETYLQPNTGGYGCEEYDMTSVMFNRTHPASDRATEEAESARKKKLASKKR
uniref:Uncharacterized protein n=1 Tax=Panagrolaimus sp. ES5 TaxID=591445 RepID=A0AC34FQQ1_9BILA